MSLSSSTCLWVYCSCGRDASRSLLFFQFLCLTRFFLSLYRRRRKYTHNSRLDRGMNGTRFVSCGGGEYLEKNSRRNGGGVRAHHFLNECQFVPPFFFCWTVFSWHFKKVWCISGYIFPSEYRKIQTTVSLVLSSSTDIKTTQLPQNNVDASGQDPITNQETHLCQLEFIYTEKDFWASILYGQITCSWSFLWQA